LQLLLAIYFQRKKLASAPYINSKCAVMDKGGGNTRVPSCVRACLPACVRARMIPFIHACRSLDWRLEVEAGSRMRRGIGGEGAASAAAASFMLQLETVNAGRIETLHLQAGF
jgi:hypothetical protein